MSGTDIERKSCRRRNCWPLCTLAYCGWLYWMSSGPVSVIATGFSGLDKLSHVAAYGLLAVLCVLSMERGARNWPPTALFWIPALFAAVYGISDELHQYFVPSRQADLLDWLADAAGGMAGSGGMALTRKYRFAWGGWAWIRLCTAGYGVPPEHD